MAHEAVLTMGQLQHLDVIVQNNIDMARETENLDLPRDVIHKGVQAVLEGGVGARYYLLVAEQGDIVAQLMITTEWSDWRAAVVWWIQSVYVPPPHRSKGAFKKLYQLVKAEAEKAGAAGLRLYADTDNERAHTVYERLGMASHYKVFEDMFTHY